MLEVYLFRGKHPLYETLVLHPPEGVEYLPKKVAQGSEEYSLYGSSHSMLRSLVDDAFAIARLPRMVPILRRYDLVHSSRGFIPRGPNNFVVDIEHASSFVGMHHPRMRSAGVRKAISKLLASPKCGALLPHCEAAKRTLALISPDDKLARKSVIVYPAVSLGAKPRVRPEGPPNILFIGEYYWKGGREVIDACLSMADKLDFKLTYISLRVHPPEPDIQKARAKLDLEYVVGPIPRRRLLEEVYPSSSVFVMPTYIDTFGYAFLEAMALGVPCIGTRHFAVPEIVEHGVTGLLVDPPKSYFDESGLGHPEYAPDSWKTGATAEQLRVALSSLIESDTQRARMGREGQRAVMEGKFSIARRNGILREVYETSARKAG